MVDLRPTEAEEAEVLCQWMDVQGIWYIHIPNEGRRSYKLGKALKRQGLTKGVPDYCILSYPNHEEYAEVDGICPPVWLELKRVGGRLTTSQAIFLDDLHMTGYVAGVCYGADEAIDWLKTMGY